MTISTKVIELDGAGAGSVHVPPSYYVGAGGVGHVDNQGDDLGTVLLTQGTARFVFGPVNVSGGAAHGEGTLFFDVC